ncbi:MAG: FHA domain-containing protein [Clostridia bacterium]|nr:FHA domain-containing protein [Clostridia bacterium]
MVFPLLERLYKNGLRLWHDAEIRKARIDYTRNWKEAQAKSSVGIAYLSRNAVNSHIFRERLNHAVENKLPLIIISTVADENLSPGMRLQTACAAHIIRAEGLSACALSERIAALQELRNCMGSPVPDFALTPDTPSSEGERLQCRRKRKTSPSDCTVLELMGRPGTSRTVSAAEDVHSEPGEKPNQSAGMHEPVSDEAQSATGNGDAETAPMRQPCVEPADSSLEKTILLNTTEASESTDYEETIIPQKAILPVIVSMYAREKKRGFLGETVIGRAKKKQESSADISFADPCRFFSRRHFQLLFVDGVCVLVCSHSNGMNVNGKDVMEGERYTVDMEAVVQIPSNATLSQFQGGSVSPTYILIAEGKCATVYWNAESFAFLQSQETGEVRCFTDTFSLGRNNAWKTNVLRSKSISRDHGVIFVENDHFFYRDDSANGTTVNGKRIDHHETVQLNNLDVISVQGDNGKEERFIFHCCILDRRKD